MRCAHCGKRRKLYAWNFKICADKHEPREHELCFECDKQFNLVVLRFFGYKGATGIVKLYKRPY